MFSSTSFFKITSSCPCSQMRITKIVYTHHSYTGSSLSKSGLQGHWVSLNLLTLCITVALLDKWSIDYVTSKCKSSLRAIAKTTQN